MTTRTPLRVGVIGASAERSWARQAHLPALAQLPEYQISAVATPSATTAAHAARLWGARHAFHDARHLVEHPDVDLVTIAVPLPGRHHVLDAALAAGKHVYCEWPLASDVDAARHYRDAAAAARVHHAVGLQTRHHPAVRLMREVLAEGRIGELLSVSMTYSSSTPFFRSPREADMLASGAYDQLATVGGHAIDLFRFAVGDLVELSATLATRVATVTVEATGDSVAVATPDQVAVLGTLASGAVASIQLTTGSPSGAGYRLEAHGRTGRALLRSTDASLVAPDLALFLSHGRFDTYTRLATPAGEGGSSSDSAVAVGNVRRTYAGLAEAVRTGAAVEPNFDTGVAMHRLLDAIALSAATGRRQILVGAERTTAAVLTPAGSPGR